MNAFLQLSSLLLFAHVHAGESLHSGASICTTPPAFITPSSTQLASHKNNPISPEISSSSSSSSSLSSIVDRHENIEKLFNDVIHGADDTAQLLRDEVKSRLLTAIDDYSSMQAREEAIARKAKELNEKVDNDRGYVYRLLRRIVRKLARSKNKASNDEITKSTRSRGILTSDSLRQTKLEIGSAGEKVVEIAQQLALLNPTAIPTLGFKHYGGAPPTDSKLAGNWKLRFTTAADASFSESEKRGVATTSQVIDAGKGTFTNVVDFEKGKLKGFRVVVEGEPTSATDIGLYFKSVSILRKSRFRLFGKFTIRLPSRLIRWLASRNKVEGERNAGPYLRLRYVDDNLRMHVTDSDNWFIQTRL